MQRIGWWLVAILALLIALYRLRVAFVGESTFPKVLADSFRARPWGIFMHALLSALALGPFQFHRGAAHREWMMPSFALLFAAVTLRIYLPFSINHYGAFTPACQVVSWLCWVPNLLWAEWYLARLRLRPVPV